MLLYFFFPPCCLCKHRLPRNKCFRSNRWRWLHLGLSLVYTVTNIAYIVADILISDARADTSVAYGSDGSNRCINKP